MNCICKLNDLPLNTRGKIININCTKIAKRRLLDLGFTNDTFITPILSSPSGGVRAYWIRNSLVSIRNDDSKNISIIF